MDQESNHSTPHKSPYRKLVVMVLLSFVAMYILMYSMVDKIANVIPNINQLYMAGLMTAPMVVIELIIMGKMYPNKKVNGMVVLIASIALVSCFLLIRSQAAVTDRQFLKSMIPHHAAAILMVKEANLKDPEVRILADSIVSAQEREIAFMKLKIEQLEKHDQ